MNGILNFLKKNWYWVAAVVLLIVVVVIIRRRKRQILYYNPETGEDIVDSADNKATFPLTPRSLAGAYSNKKGSMGSQIKTLQRFYNENNKSGTPLDVDGKYGPKSLGAFLGFFGDEISSNGVITEAQFGQIVIKHGKDY